MSIESKVFNIDCVEFMKQYPDNHWELAICDPPYGIDCAKTINISNKSKGFRGNKIHDSKAWDNSIPPKEYFFELKRVSKNQIIWGGNYFTEYLEPTKAWIFWDKKENKNQGSNFSDGELAWTSYKKVTKYFRFGWIGVDYINNNEDRKIHPTQKPVALYKWILNNYAKEGDKILDTHLGSASSRIAAHDMKFDFVGCELDKEYFDAAEFRYQEHIKQLTLF